MSDLTFRKQEILVLVEQGCKNREVAWQFAVTENTINRRLARIYEKLSVHTRQDAVKEWRKRYPDF